MSNNNEIVKLSDSQHHRLRTEMYLGSRVPHTQTVINWNGKELEAQEVIWTPAAFAAFREIFDNALDEVVGHRHGSKIDVTYDEKTSSFSVTDDGRGIPIDWDETERMHKATLALTQSRAGRNFGDRGEVRGTNGVGSSVVVNCSEKFFVEIVRDNKKFQQLITEGTELLPDQVIHDPKITKTTSTKTGTSITFKLSNQVFKEKIIIPTEFIKARVYEVAANHPNIKFTFNNNVIQTKSTLEKTLFSNKKIISIHVNEPGFKCSYYLDPNFAESGEYLHSTVNDIPAFNGGNHIDTFKKLFYGGLISQLEKESKKRGLTPNRSDISDGMLIYNSTVMVAPNFDSQSKSRLINSEVDKHLKTALESEDLYKTIIKSNREWIDSIYERCAARTQKKDIQDLAKANRKLMRTKVPRLLDANGRDRTKCILVIAEGNSASGALASVRDPDIHGALPLRGKILNVRGEKPKDVMENQIISDMMNALGLSIGQKAIRKDLRYGQVYIATDQDQDGFNISALLVNFFYIYWPELFDPKQVPFFYAFQTPFIIQEKGKKRHYWYADDYHTYNPLDWKGAPAPTRAKGLGSLEKVDWIYSLENPKLIPLVDDGDLSDALDLIFNHKKADLRKEWISLCPANK